MFASVKALGPVDLHLPLDAEVPERDAVQELPVLLDRVTVVARVVHVVVEAVHLHAVAPGGVEERRLADPRVQKDLGVLDDLRHCSFPPLGWPGFTTTVLSSVNSPSRSAADAPDTTLGADPAATG